MFKHLLLLIVASIAIVGCSKDSEKADVAVDTTVDVAVDAGATDAAAADSVDVTAAVDVSPTQSVSPDASAQD
jgi:uncharacterized lipoprotein NlpE involved in copper resistance